MPALGNTCLFYLAPLIVAQLAGRLTGGAGTDAATVLPHVLGFAALMLLAEILCRVGVHCMNRADGRGIEHLYVTGMNELLVKDAAFFHDNFAGSLTKRVLSFATRFRAVRRHTGVLRRRQPGAAGVRVGDPVAPRPAARRCPSWPHRGHRAGHRSARPAPSGTRRPAGGRHRTGVRTRCRQPDEHGDGAPSPRRTTKPPSTGHGSPNSARSPSAPGTAPTSASTPWSRRCRCSPTRSVCFSRSASAAGGSAWRRSWSPSPTSRTRPGSCSSSIRSIGSWRAA